jgi:hypothetical protein
MDRTDADAEFLVQFAPQRFFDRLPGFQLAARKLPIALVDLATRPAGEEESAFGIDQHAHRDVDRRARAVAGQAACLPA